MKRLLCALFTLLILSALKPASDLFRQPDDWPKPFYEFSKNTLEEHKVALGRKLFYDPILSADGSISCASCHSPFSAFAHTDHAISHGIHDSVGTRNAPGLFNLAWRNSFMWDGAINHLDVQPLAPIHHPSEMGSDIKEVITRLSSSSDYTYRFNMAYSDTAVTGERILKSLAQFLLTLTSSNSRYDSVKAGTSSFTDQESRGYMLFKKNCNSCHREPLFFSNEFTENGLATIGEEEDLGRYNVTHDPADSLRFHVPSLRNLSFTFPYMHDGRFKKLQDVINHYSDGDYRNSVQDLRLKSMERLTAAQKVDLLSFLLTLNDRRFVFESKHQDPASYSGLQYNQPHQ